MESSVLKKALQAFVSEQSGLAGKRVIWERQGAPVPPPGQDFISLSIDAVTAIGTDVLVTPPVGSLSDQTTTEGIRDFVLHVRVFSEDYLRITTAIQNAFASGERFYGLQKKQVVHMTMSVDVSGADVWEWSIEGYPFSLAYAAPPALDTILEAAAAEMTACLYLSDFTFEADLDTEVVKIAYDVGREFQFASDDDKVSLDLIQDAVDLGFRGDYGVLSAPDEIRAEFGGTGLLDVVLSTHSLVIESMEFIERVEVTDEGTGSEFIVDIDVPPAT